MIAASRLAEVDRELEAFGVEASKLEALYASLRQRTWTSEDVEAFLADGVSSPLVAPFVAPAGSDAEVTAEAPAEDALDAAMPELPAVETSVSAVPEEETFEAAAPSQEIELDDDIVVPQASVAASTPTATDDDDTDFPAEGTELIRPGARELELEFDGDLSMGSEPIHFETPATGTQRPVRPSRMPLSQADLDAELAAILSDPDDRASDPGELAGRQSLVDVDVDVSDEMDVSVAEPSDAVDVTDVAEVTEVAELASLVASPPEASTSSRPPPLPGRPSSVAPPPDDAPGFLGRLLNKK